MGIKYIKEIIMSFPYCFYDSPPTSEGIDHKYAGPAQDPQQKEYKQEITFDSDKELLERKRAVKIGTDLVGYLIKDRSKMEWELHHISSYLTMKEMIAITEKLKELNGCSALNDKYAKQQREAFNRLCK